MKPLDRDKLGKVLAMTTSSNNDAEALVAVRLAGHMLKESVSLGCSWSQVVEDHPRRAHRRHRRRLARCPTSRSSRLQASGARWKHAAAWIVAHLDNRRLRAKPVPVRLQRRTPNREAACCPAEASMKRRRAYPPKRRPRRIEPPVRHTLCAVCWRSSRGFQFWLDRIGGRHHDACSMPASTPSSFDTRATRR